MGQHIPLHDENHMIRHNYLTLPVVLISETGRLGRKSLKSKINKTTQSTSSGPLSCLLFHLLHISCWDKDSRWSVVVWVGALLTRCQTDTRLPEVAQKHTVKHHPVPWVEIWAEEREEQQRSCRALAGSLTHRALAQSPAWKVGKMACT